MLDIRENSNQFLTKKNEHVILFLQWYVWFKNVVKLFLKYNVKYFWHPGTGSRSTFEFPSRVNLSGPSLYYIARKLGN